jgi:hypothetical protein
MEGSTGLKGYRGADEYGTRLKVDFPQSSYELPNVKP